MACLNYPLSINIERQLLTWKSPLSYIVNVFGNILKLRPMRQTNGDLMCATCDV